MWNDAIEQYKAYVTLERGLSVNSVGVYIADIRKLATWCESNEITDPAHVTPIVLKNFATWAKQAGTTTRSLDRIIASLRSFFSYLLTEGVLAHNPALMLKYSNTPRPKPTILNPEEFEALLLGLEMFKPECHRNKAMLGLMYTAGLSVSELIGLKVSDIDFRTNCIYIEGEGHKTRVIPLTPTARQYVKPYFKTFRESLNTPPDTLFLNNRGTSLSRIMVFNIVKHLAEKVGFVKKISPSTFRHSFAYNLIQSGTDLKTVKKMLGFTSASMLDVYIN